MQFTFKLRVLLGIALLVLCLLGFIWFTSDDEGFADSQATEPAASMKARRRRRQKKKNATAVM